ncbi:hypothetical protein TRVL_00495 [Trypanosoma vivax]|nr:hypothetical protein TRVL_00495 [Trypanosoma vivax]
MTAAPVRWILHDLTHRVTRKSIAIWTCRVHVLADGTPLNYFVGFYAFGDLFPLLFSRSSGLVWLVPWVRILFKWRQCLSIEWKFAAYSKRLPRHFVPTTVVFGVSMKWPRKAFSHFHCGRYCA